MLGEERSTEEYENRRRELEEFFEIRIKDNNSRILVYDSDWCSGKSPGSILELLKNPNKFGFCQSIRCENVKMNLPWSLEKKTTYGSMPNECLPLDIGQSDIVEISPTPTIYSPITRKEKYGADLDNYNFRGRISKCRLHYVKELKDYGKTIGEEIRRELKGGKEE